MFNFRLIPLDHITYVIKSDLQCNGMLFFGTMVIVCFPEWLVHSDSYQVFQCMSCCCLYTEGAVAGKFSILNFAICHFVCVCHLLSSLTCLFPNNELAYIAFCFVHVILKVSTCLNFWSLMCFVSSSIGLTITSLSWATISRWWISHSITH